jgi:hypothetical protein
MRQTVDCVPGKRRISKRKPGSNIESSNGFSEKRIESKRPYNHRRDFETEADLLKNLRSLYNDHGLRISNCNISSREQVSSKL